MYKKAQGKYLFIVRFKKPRVEAEEEAYLTLDGEDAEYELPGFMSGLDLREGDGVVVSWKIVSRLKTERVKVRK